MSFSDPIADLLTRIRNATRARHRFVDVQWSKMKEQIVNILQQQGFVEGHLIREEGVAKRMRVFLKYGPSRRPILNQLVRVSKPGSRRYVGREHIPNVLGGMGLAIVSTSQGIMSGEDARRKGVGGELLCKVW